MRTENSRNQTGSNKPRFTKKSVGDRTPSFGSNRKTSSGRPPSLKASSSERRGMTMSGGKSTDATSASGFGKTLRKNRPGDRKRLPGGSGPFARSGRSYRDDRPERPLELKREKKPVFDRMPEKGKSRQAIDKGRKLILRKEKRPTKRQLLQELGQTSDRSHTHHKVEKEELIRLNRYIANAGICSRREADTYIASGVVKINGQVVTELGTKVSPTDEVRFDDRLVMPERKVYLLLNKPKDVVTTTDDPHAELTVMDIVKDACEERIYPVGRLDRNTTGVLLLTNDGELAKRLTHPSHKVEKVYQVTLDKSVSVNDIQKVAAGIELDDGFIAADAITYVEGRNKDTLGIEIHSGRHRIVRRIFESLGYRVKALDRVSFAGLTKKNIPRGKWRFLSPREVSFLKMK